MSRRCASERPRPTVGTAGMAERSDVDNTAVEPVEWRSVIPTTISRPLLAAIIIIC